MVKRPRSTLGAEQQDRRLHSGPRAAAGAAAAQTPWAVDGAAEDSGS